MAYNPYASHTFYFDYELERGDEYLDVEVTYAFDGGDVSLESVLHDGKELDTTDAEDRALLAYARERCHEDIADAAADYGDYLRDLRQDAEY